MVKADEGRVFVYPARLPDFLYLQTGWRKAIRQMPGSVTVYQLPATWMVMDIQISLLEHICLTMEKQMKAGYSFTRLSFRTFFICKLDGGKRSGSCILRILRLSSRRCQRRWIFGCDSQEQLVLITDRQMKAKRLFTTVRLQDSTTDNWNAKAISLIPIRHQRSNSRWC